MNPLKELRLNSPAEQANVIRALVQRIELLEEAVNDLHARTRKGGNTRSTLMEILERAHETNGASQSP
jgi:hypothetical protein